tara:strand:+ start:177 stop:620 length:444 start_codon:yes stop_codon:yes gene_type:complete
MAINSQVVAVRNAFKTQLDSRGALSGVSIFKYPPMDQAPKKEMIFFGDASSSIDFEAFGTVYEEDLDLKVFIYVLRAGAGDSVASTTETRALALANEIIDQLADDSTINGTVIVANVSNMQVENGVSDDGRICSIEIDIDAQATLSE